MRSSVNRLRNAHAAVRAACGMKPDEDILASLLKINLELRLIVKFLVLNSRQLVQFVSKGFLFPGVCPGKNRCFPTPFMVRFMQPLLP